MKKIFFFTIINFILGMFFFANMSYAFHPCYWNYGIAEIIYYAQPPPQLIPIYIQPINYVFTLNSDAGHSTAGIEGVQSCLNIVATCNIQSDLINNIPCYPAKARSNTALNATVMLHVPRSIPSFSMVRDGRKFQSDKVRLVMKTSILTRDNSLINIIHPNNNVKYNSLTVV